MTQRCMRPETRLGWLAALALVTVVTLTGAAPAAAQPVVTLTDSGGTSQTEYFYSAPGNRIYVRVEDASIPSSTASILGTVYIQIPPSTQYDRENVILLQQAPGVYFGPAGGLPVAFAAATLFNGTAEGHNGDLVVADYGGTLISAPIRKHPVASTTRLVDSADADTTIYFIGTEQVVVLVTDDDENDSSTVADTIQVSLSTSNGDGEPLTLTETGVNTGIFRGSINSSTAALVVGDGTLQVDNGVQVTATYNDPDGGDTSSDTATFIRVTPSTTLLTDGSGGEQATYLIGSQGVYVTVMDGDENTNFSTQQQVTAVVVDGITGDTETVTLVETTSNSGIFRNAATGLATAVGTANSGDGILQTADGSVISATYTDDDGGGDSSGDTANTAVTPAASSTRFTDSAGNDVTWYTIAANDIRVTVTDADENKSTAVQTVTVVVASPTTGDSETLTLTETGGNTGIFRNTTALNSIKLIGGLASNARLETWPLDAITATYTDVDGGDTSSDTASMRYLTSATVSITTTSGTVPTPDRFRIAVDDLYITVNDDDENVNAAVAETLVATFTVNTTGDVEAGIVLTETGPDTGVFRNTTGLFSLISSAAVNGIVDATEGAILTARYVDDDDPADDRSDTTTLVALQTPALIAFTSAGATGVTSYLVASDLVFVTLDDPDENSDATTVQTVQVTLTSFATGDVEHLTLSEVNPSTLAADPDSGFFMNATGLPTAIAPRSDDNGTLGVGDGTLVQVQYQDDDDSSDTASDLATMRVTQTASTCQLTDSAGVPTGVIQIGNAIYVTVTDPDENTSASTRQSVIVTVRNDMNFDGATLTLQETDVNTGIFRNTTGLATSIQSGGVVTDVAPFEANDGDTITVTYRDNDTPSDLSFAYGVFQYLTNATIKFTDSTGGPLISDYEIGFIADGVSPIYIQVTDPDENHDPLDQEVIYVNLYDLRTGGDQFLWGNYPDTTNPLGNPVELTETTSSSGVFRSTTGLESEIALVIGIDDTLQTVDGAQIQAVYTDPTDPTDVRQSNIATMHVVQLGSVPYFADDTGTPPTPPEYYIGATLPADMIWLVVEDEDENGNPAVVESVKVTVTCAATLDSEQFTLTEADPTTLAPDPNSGYFIFGPIASSTDFRILNDGVLQVARNAEIRMRYQDDDDVADFGDDFATMLPDPVNASIIEFTDAAGTIVTTYVIGVDPVYVTMTDPDANGNGSVIETVICTITVDTIFDVQANVQLRETTSASGIFRSILPLPLALATPGVYYNGTLECVDGSILDVTYQDALDPGDTATASAEAVIGPEVSMTRFTDSVGTTQTAFTIGADLFVTVWDKDENGDPAAIDTVDVIVTSPVTGDGETFTLDETGPNTGIFRNTVAIDTDVDFPVAGDGTLQVSAGETVVVDYVDSDDPTDVSTHAATMVMPSVPYSEFVFIDGSSVPGGADTTSYFIGQELVYIRLVDLDRNRSALTTDTVTVYVTDPINGDTVSVTLYEVTSNSDTFENWVAGVPTAVNLPLTTDYVLDTFHGATIYADYVDPDDALETAQTTAAVYVFEDSSTVSFTNQAGTTVTSFWIDPLRPPSLGNGELIYVTVWDDDENLNASTSETLIVTLTSTATSDVLTNVVLTETGPDTGVFRNLSGINSQVGLAVIGDMILQTAEGDTITVEYTDSEDPTDTTSETATMNIRQTGTIVQFTNVGGVSQTSYYINVNQVFVTVRDPDQNGDASVQETITVDIESALTGDWESITLTELTSDSDTFRNLVGLSSVVSVATQLNGVLETQGGDVITVTYVDPDDALDTGTDTATMLRLPTVSQVSFIIATAPAPATPATSHVIRMDRILVEVYDPDENDDPSAIDVVQVRITSPQSSDLEILECYETGPNTGYFQTLTADGIFSDIVIPIPADGTFQTVWPSDLTVTYIDNDFLTDQSTHTIPTVMFQTPGSVWFSSVDGTAQTTFAIARDLVYVTVEDEDANTDWSSAQSVVCTIYETATGDLLELTLFETADNSGMFRNFLSGVPSQVALADTTNGVIDTGAWHEIMVLYQDAADVTDISSDTATMLLEPTTSVVRFTDFFGTTRTYYTIEWDGIFVEVTDPDKNEDPSIQETLICTVYDDDTSDYETLDLTETTSSSGIFRSLGMASITSFGIPEDGVLQTHDQSLIRVLYQDEVYPTDQSTSTARMFVASSNSTIEFIDDLGLPAPFYSFGTGFDEVYVRVTDYDENTNPLSQQGVTVTVLCTASGDSETLVLVENGVDDDQFENLLGLPTMIRSTGTPGNGVIEGPLGEFITAIYVDNDNPVSQPALDRSVTTAEIRVPQTISTVFFTNAAGATITSFLANRSNIFVTVTDPDQNLDPNALDTVTVTIDTGLPIFDRIVSLTLTEIGLNAGVFRNSTPVASVIAVAATTTDQILQVQEEVVGDGYDSIEVTYQDPTDGTDLQTHDADVTYRTYSEIAFTDAAGTTMTTYVIGVTGIYVTLRDEDRNQLPGIRETVIVTVTADYNGDTEHLTLTETGVDTGIFRNSIPRNSVYAQDPTSNDSIVQTIAAATPPPQYILTVDYEDPFDPTDASSATVDMVPANPNDRDGDGIPNSVEDALPGVLDPDDPADASQDFDGDGRINLLEYLQGTSITDPSDNMPVANPGWLPALDPSLVELDGTASYDPSTHPPSGLVAYGWTQTDGPVIVTLSDPSSLTPVFVGRTAGDYEFELRVRDADGAENTGYTTVTINQVPPNAEVIAGATVDWTPGATFVLEGRGTIDANRDPIAYSWTSPLVLTNGATATPSFPVPAGPGVYPFMLQAIGTGPSNAAIERVIVHNPSLNWHVPTADAGADQTMAVGDLVTLDGTRSTDYDMPTTPTFGSYLWTQPGGPLVALNTTVPSRPTFTPVLPGVYTFELTVNDSSFLTPSLADSVTVVVNAPAAHVPTANAGPDGFGTQYLEYVLNGSGSADSDGTPLTYAWTQVRGESTPLSDTTTDRPSFTPITPGVYEWELTVSDGVYASAPDRVSVIIDGLGDQVPRANAGLDQTVLLGTAPSVVFTLDGSASVDPDGSPLTYYWRQIRGTSSSLSDYRNVRPTMTARVPGIYEFELMVYDGTRFSRPDRVVVVVVGTNLPPVSNAGPDRSVFLDAITGLATVSLDGRGSYDPDNLPSPLTYLWTQTGGASVGLSSTTTTTPFFVATVPGDYTFSLRVDDGQLYAEDSVTIHVMAPGNSIPVANAGADQTVYIDQLVTLNGAGSYDADGDGYTFLWTQIDGPASLVLSSRFIAQPNFVPRVKGVYTFRLDVQGDDGQSYDTVNIYVIGGSTGGGGGTGDVDLGGGDGGGGGGGCTVAPSGSSPSPAGLLVLLLPVLVALGRRRLVTARVRTHER